jgi:hypothetical protein
MRNLLKLSIILMFLSGLANAQEGTLRLGVELGYSPVELEAEETAQYIANVSGSTVTTEYSTGVLVGRVFADYGLSENLLGEVGYFRTSGANATYKIGADSAQESYTAHGFDLSAKFISDGLFGKVGMHSTTIDGDASVTIGSTTYSATGESQGTGLLFGAGLEIDQTLISVTRYNDVGGISDFTFFSVGLLF